jgi:hypothetical protein
MCTPRQCFLHWWVNVCMCVCVCMWVGGRERVGESADRRMRAAEVVQAAVEQGQQRCLDRREGRRQRHSPLLHRQRHTVQCPLHIRMKPSIDMHTDTRTERERENVCVWRARES